MSTLLSKKKEDFFMLYDVVVNEWEEVTYVPTTLGNVLLGLIFAALLAAAVLFAGKKSKDKTKSTRGKLTAKQLAFCAVSIALGTVLSNIKVFRLPYSGSVTLLSMLVICLPGYWFGLGAGLMTGVAYGILQLIIGPYVLFPMQLLVDYPLAFGALGLSGLFSNAKNGLMKGYAVGVVGRWVFAVISGWIFFYEYAWEGWDPLPYSLVYNAIYIFAEAAITLLILAIPPVKKAFAKVKELALE